MGDCQIQCINELFPVFVSLTENLHNFLIFSIDFSNLGAALTKTGRYANLCLGEYGGLSNIGY